MGACTMPNLSVRNSTLPPFTSRTARATSCVTVPDFGFGINPRGPRILPSGPTRDIRSGVATAASKSVQPSDTFLTRSSPPTKSAPASWASRALSPTAKTATRTFLPVPLGRTTDPRTICSAWRGSTPRRMCASTVASNFEIDVSFASATASSGFSPPLPLAAMAASTFLAASMYFLPCRLLMALLDNLEAHRPRSALDHLHRRLGLERVEVLALGLDDGPDLLLGDAADLLAVRLRRTFVDAGGALQQIHGRRRLEHERERAVLEDRDLGRDDITGLRSGALVVGLGELHDVDSVRAQRGAHRRRRRGAPSLKLELQDRADFLLAHWDLMDLFDLQQVQLDRSLTAEHVDQHLELALFRVDLIDLAVEVRERPIDDAHRLSDLELDTDLGRFLLHLLLDRPHLFFLKRHRAVGRADESGHARGVANHEPRVVRHHHADKDVAGEDSLLDVTALAVLDLDLVLHGDEHLQDLVLHVHRLDPLLEVLLDLLFVPGVGVDHVPLRFLLGRTPFHRHQCAVPL